MTEDFEFLPLKAEIDEIDQLVLESFNMPRPFCAVLPNQYRIDIDTDDDFQLLLLLLASFHWTLVEYMQHTVIDWTFTEPLVSNLQPQ